MQNMLSIRIFSPLGHINKYRAIFAGFVHVIVIIWKSSIIAFILKCFDLKAASVALCGTSKKRSLDRSEREEYDMQRERRKDVHANQ